MILDDATSSSASSGAIGYFDIEEIIPGKDRAADSHGAFHVRDVKGFMLAAKEEEEEDFDMTRTLMAAQAASKQQVYAMKTIHHSSFSDCPHREFKKAVAHLSNEAAMMSVLRHKNILELRGVASSGTEAYCETGRHDAYFIITEALTESLSSKLNSWRRNQRKFQLRRPSKSSSAKERLQIAYSLADALEYLHSFGIIHRRLNPNCVGFNSMNQVRTTPWTQGCRSLR